MESNVKTDALKCIMYDLNDLQHKYDAPKKAETVTIKGEVYHSANEVEDAYGCDIITSTQCDRAVRKFEGACDPEKERIREACSDIVDDLKFEIKTEIEDCARSNVQNIWNNVSDRMPSYKETIEAETKEGNTKEGKCVIIDSECFEIKDAVAWRKI